MQEIKCAICGKKQKKRLLYKANFNKSHLTTHTFSARRSPDRIHYQINKCQRCSLIFSSPIYSNDSIFSFYEKSINSYKPQIKYLTKTYLDLFNKAVNNSSRKLSVLEIGCGDGFFLNALLQKGYSNLYGVEPSSVMVKESHPKIRKNIKQDVFKKGLFKKEKFDVVTCFHTLDHVTNPNEVIAESAKLLKKNGLALYVVHDNSALSAKIFGEKSPIIDIEHIYLFNKITLSKIFKKNGFKNVEVENLTNTYPLEYWVKMAGIPPIFKRVISGLLKRTKTQRLNLSLAGGNIYIVAKK